MNTKKKKNRIILCICSILVLFASIFAVIPFNKDTKVVKADSISDYYTFSGSPLYAKISGLVNDSYINAYHDISILFSFTSDIDGHIVGLGCDFSFVNGGRHRPSWTLPLDSSLGNLDYTVTFSSTNVQIFRFHYQFDGDRLMGKPVGFDLLCLNNAYKEYTFTIRYFDKDLNFLIVSFVFMGNYAYPNTHYTLPIRRYYFADALENSDFLYNEAYQQGKLEGITIGEDLGYSDGFAAGEDSGYWQGYNQAIENDDRYSFTNLIASVIDVPVQTFTSLFNFEILGINLSGFFLGLLTCCIVIGVIRLIL